MANLKSISKSKITKAGLSLVGSNDRILRQSYDAERLPEGVIFIKQSVFKEEMGGHFMELVRFDKGFVKSLLEQGVKLNLSGGQVASAVVAPQTERFGHLHRDQQEFWMVVEGTITCGLYDTRKKSKTYKMKKKIVLQVGNGVFIPKGIVHGLANYTKDKSVLVYFPNMQFDTSENSQEWRYVSKDPHFWDFVKPDRV